MDTSTAIAIGISAAITCVCMACFGRAWLVTGRRGLRRACFWVYLTLLFWPFVRVRRWWLRCKHGRRRHGDQVQVLYLDVMTGDAQRMWAPPMRPGFTRFVCVSDTHLGLELLALPPGDVLLHCGDLLIQDRGVTGNGKRLLQEFNHQLGRIPIPHKIVIGGNHDQTLEDLGAQGAAMILSNGVYLHHSTHALPSGHVVFGSPVSMGASDNRAFQPRDDAQMEDIVLRGLRQARSVHRNVHIVMLHGPPRTNLRRALAQHETGIQVVLFGHFHGGYGRPRKEHNTVFLNVASMDAMYGPTHPPVVIDLPNS